MKIAIVGYGNIGKIHYEIIRKLGYEVCAVCDIVYNKIKDLNVNKYTDFTKMLAKERPDVVHSGLHKSIINLQNLEIQANRY